MSGEINFSVPALPPSVNNYWRVKRGGGRYVSAEGVAFKKLVIQHAFFKRVGSGKKGIKYKLAIKFYSPSWITKKKTIAKIDLDNKLKSSCDALCEACHVDDSQIFEIYVEKTIGNEESTHFLLSELE